MVEINTVNGLLATVRETGLPAILPALALDGPSGAGLAGVALTEPTPRRQVGILYRLRAHQCAATRAFVRIAREVVGQH